MKKNKKKLILILTIIHFFFSCTYVSAAGNQVFLIGRNYGDGLDTSVDVSRARTAFINSTKTVISSTNPTISYVKSSRNSVPYMESDVIFFSGHGYNNGIGMMFYDTNSSSSEYSFFINGGSNSATTVGLSSYNMSNVSLAIFAGCETSNGTSSIAYIANQRGTRTTLGWNTDVYDIDQTQWLSNFWQQISLRQNVSYAVRIADSYSYYENSSIKNHGLYGNSLNIITSINPDVGILGITPVDTRENIVNINVKNMNEKQILNKIENWIVENLNQNFDLSQFELTKTVQNDKIIYDFTLLLQNEIKSSIGYTVFVNNEKINAIYDNTKKINISDLLSTVMLNNVTISELQNNISRLNNSIDIKKYNIISQKTYKYYDDTDNRVYQVVNTVLEDKNTTARFTNISRVLLSN